MPEFSEADMQRAIEAKEADDKENDIIDEDVEGVEDGMDWCNPVKYLDFTR